MFNKIIRFSANNKFLVIGITLILILISNYFIKLSSLDAIPDLSENQVIVYTKWERSPNIIEDIITYPIIKALQGIPKLRTLRGLSDYGVSYVYVIFEDQVDIYWARNRVTEYLSKMISNLPKDAKLELGPDASSLGWIYQYVLIDDSQSLNLAELRSLQDYNLKVNLQGVTGVAEVASLGGFDKQYQVNLDPMKLQYFNKSILDVTKALKSASGSTSARVIEISGAEFMIKTDGYLKDLSDIENVSIGVSSDRVPIILKNVANIELGPEMRRGVSDYNGLGDTSGGIVIMKQGENALNVINSVKKKLNEIESSLPKGVKVVPVYDRSTLIESSIGTLKRDLLLELLIVSLVIFLFLWHIPSAIVPVVTIPIAVYLVFIPFYLLGLTINIMSLAGIGISIGVLVDGAIIEVENAYRRLYEWNQSGRKTDFHETRLNSILEVAPTVFFSLLIIAVSFLPVFSLTGEEGKLFGPLAISKTLAMVIAAGLAITLDPAIRLLFTRMNPFNFKSKLLSLIANKIFVGKYFSEVSHPVSKRLFSIYEPILRYVLRKPKFTISIALTLFFLTLIPFMRLGNEFMPRLNEGSILYMPTAVPGMSVTEALKILRIEDQVISSFGEVRSVYGKAGRAETVTDPAPFSMIETVVVLKEEKDWPKVDRFYSKYPLVFQYPFQIFLPPIRTYDELINDLDQALKIPGMPNIWTMPIKNRIDMLSTGIRTPIGIKILGADLNQIEKLGSEIEKELKSLKGTRNIFSEKTSAGYYVDIDLKRNELARYELSVEEANEAINAAIGGENVTYLIEGRARYQVNVRLARDFRDNLDKLKNVPIKNVNGSPVPLTAIANIKTSIGPSMIRNENGFLAGFIYIDIDNIDPENYINEARKIINEKIIIPEGVNLNFSGQYENILRVREKLKLVIPISLLLIFLLLYFNLKSYLKVLIVLLAIPFSLIGSFWLLYLLGYNLSVATWVGIIALLGLDAETGVFMLLYLDIALKERKKRNELTSEEDLKLGIIEGAAKRMRPKIMTVSSAFIGLMPIMFSFGLGSDVMKRIAAPMVGGLVTSFGLELLIYPVIYYQWYKRNATQKT